MKKTKGLWIALDSIFFVVFNVVFFVAGGVNHRTSVWISYGFILLAYFFLLLTPKWVRGGKSAAVFGFSISILSSIYFIVELITGVIFILIASEDYKAALLVQLCIAAIYGILLIPHLITNEHTADVEKARQYQVEYVKSASAKLKGMMEGVSDKGLRKKIERVYDSLSTSPVKSHPNLAQMESQILLTINELSGAISADEREIISLTDSLLILISERNRQLKMFN